MNVVQLKTLWAGNIQIQKQLHWACSSATKRYFETRGGPELKIFHGYLQLVLKSLSYGKSKCLLIEQTLKSINEITQEIENLFLDPEIFKCFQNVLMHGVKLIFDYSIPWFRVPPELRFVSYLLKLYSNLKNTISLVPAMEESYRELLDSFEYQFMTQYNIANCNIIHLDQVHDIFAKNHGLISPPVLSINDIEKRGYFRLSSSELQLNDKLVEVAQLKSGQIAILLVNGQRLPFNTGESKKLIDELLSENWELFHMGRTLLYQTIKPKDLVVCNETTNGIELVTHSENISRLRLTCLDEMAWLTHWKIYFQTLFSEKPTSMASKASASMLSSSHNFQNFKMKHTKLSNLRPSNHKGIALNIASDLNKDDHKQSDSIQDDLDEFKFDIHPSKPVANNIDTLISDEVIAKSPPVTDASLRDIEFLSYDKLVELDKSLQLDLSPKLLQSPEPSNFKTVSHSFSLDKINDITQNIAEVSDGESIISNDNENNELVFNPSVEEYRPQLLGRKSSSLFNIFSLKNKKKLKIETAGLQSDSTPSLRSASSTRTFFSVKSEDSITSIVDQYIENPENLEIENPVDIFKCKISKASYWDNSKWQVLSTIPLSLSIVKAAQGILLILQNPSNTGRFKIVTKITTSCKSHRSTAKDIQITIPGSQILASIFTSVTNSSSNHVLSLRSDDIERLKNVIDHCIKGTLLSSISTTTSRTLSSQASSSCMSKSSSNVSRSSTEASDLDVKLLATKRPVLLLSDIKTRLHTKNNNKWTPHRIGLVNIYHAEGAKTEIMLELSTDRKETMQFKTGSQDMKRLGRTGISLIDNSEYLFEFPNSVITEQVYRNIASCNI
ncbi:Rbh2p RNJ42_01647 [Nakaseomyces bracarensis]|uniref:Rbh2p n=1 Tax=Nakaseomyces bracarensis TaxID=273131 RepID=UPI003871A74D